MRPRRGVSLLGLALAGGCTGFARAQGPLGAVESDREGQVAFAFAARRDVCGFGVASLRVGGEGPFDRTVRSWSSGDGWGPCERGGGPVRVLVTRAEGATVGIRVAVGGGPLPEGVRDLGPVAAGTAGAYLLELAARLEGRVARDALTAAVLADSAETWQGLRRLATDRRLAAGLRESAAGWLGREAALASAEGRREIVGALVELARDRDEPQALRRRAVTAMGRAGSEGIPILVELAGSGDAILARAAVEALGATGDPRARDRLRETIRDETQPESVRTAAVRAVLSRDARPSDYAYLREAFVSLGAAGVRGSVIEALGQTGGAANARWLLDLAGDASAASEDRRKAVPAAVRAGAGSADLIRLFDRADDRRLKETLVDHLARIGDRAGLEKVTAVARSDTDPAVRRTAVNRLARSGDPAAARALRALVEPER